MRVSHFNSWHQRTTFAAGALLFSALFSCSSTQHKIFSQYLFGAGRDQATLMLPVRGLTEGDSFRCFQELQRIYEKEGMILKYLPGEEWNLFASMVSRKSETFVTDLATAGYTYLLDIRVTEQYSGSAYEYYTAFEVSHRINNRFDYRNQAVREQEKRGEIFLHLVATQNAKIVYQAATKTIIQPLALPGRDGDETQINLASSYAAVAKAIRKGTAKMIDRCFQ